MERHTIFVTGTTTGLFGRYLMVVYIAAGG
jgi:hypothetical protein